MYPFKYAVRVEHNTNQSNAQKRIAQGDLLDHFECKGETPLGEWFRIQLPASVWCLLLIAGDQTTSAYYHSPHDVDLELMEIFNAQETTQPK